MATGGQIVWNLDTDTSSFDRGLTRASAQAKAFGGQLSKTGAASATSFARELGSSFDSVALGLGRVLKVGSVAGLAVATGLGLASKAAFNQVDAVQQATVALRAYEKDGTKVTKVLSDLVAFARSDLGVLFNRKELFASAQGLKIMGDDTSKLTGHVKILARSVGLGLSTFDELTQIVGRVGSTGRLTGIDFDNLTKAGFRLDDSLRNTDITFDQLFKHLDKGIPISALTGQADTIRGLTVRLQTAFRGVGESILGVNKDTGQFIKGGLGDKLVGLFKTLADLMKDPNFLNSMKNLGQSIGSFAEKALPILLKGFQFMVANSSLIIHFFTALAVAWAAASAAGVILGIVFGPITLGAFLIAAAVTAVIGVLTFLQLRFGLVSKAINFLKPIVEDLRLRFLLFVSFIKIVILAVVGLAVKFVQLVQAAVRMGLGVISAINRLKTSIFNFFAQAGSWLVDTGRSIIRGLINGIVKMAEKVWSAIQTVADKIGEFFKGAANWLWDTGKAIVQGLADGIKSGAGIVGDAAKGVAKAAVEGAEAVLKIRSPSKIFQDIGKNVSWGMAQGISAGASRVLSATQGMLPSEAGSISPTVAPNISSGELTSTGSSINVTVHQDGIMARSRSDLRYIAKDMIEAVNEELRAKVLPEIGDGNLKGVING